MTALSVTHGDACQCKCSRRGLGRLLSAHAETVYTRHTPSSPAVTIVIPRGAGARDAGGASTDAPVATGTPLGSSALGTASEAIFAVRAAPLGSDAAGTATLSGPGATAGEGADTPSRGALTAPAAAAAAAGGAGAGAAGSGMTAKSRMRPACPVWLTTRRPSRPSHTRRQPSAVATARRGAPGSHATWKGGEIIVENTPRLRLKHPTPVPTFTIASSWRRRWRTASELRSQRRTWQEKEGVQRLQETNGFFQETHRPVGRTGRNPRVRL